ncbi:DUF6415 family natural product biosynthesis protein [Streptomyces sp. PSKA30]|uniref:DUF6415 family natural product biosynthesis protein n=1 Tax=Streptomyces sp. PSKA30 TaxID=2874597 RepID=UPI001CD09995|nr:DUF6415 family natural product biosynthesis protein [Streptomyces sp. PSKA30]MBZ9641506.1 DUF6415 family natural product biosynthesis protein [Streptomyces sp. PSKA30]
MLDDLTPPEDLFEEHAQRLRGHLMRLVDVAVAARADLEDTQAARLIEQARVVRSEEVPGDHRQAVGHLRRMAWAVNELLEPWWRSSASGRRRDRAPAPVQPACRTDEREPLRENPDRVGPGALRHLARRGGRRPGQPDHLPGVAEQAAPAALRG